MLESMKRQFFEPATMFFRKQRIALSRDFVYAGTNGKVLQYDDLAWIFVRRLKLFGLIPLYTSLNAYLVNGKRVVLYRGGIKPEILDDLAREFFYHNPHCTFGYSQENAMQYRQMIRKYRNSNYEIKT